VLVAIEETISKSTKMDFSLKFILLTYLIISIEGKPQNHNGGQSHNGGIENNKGNFVSNIGDNAKHNTDFGPTSNVAEGGQGTFNAPVTKGNLPNHGIGFISDAVNCEWSTWSSIGTCSKSCEGGDQIYIRSRQVTAKNGGRDCDGLSHKTEKCNTNSCLPKQDCKWTSWSRSGSCSKSCGGGDQLYLRSHLVIAQNGGLQCPGNSHKFEKCNTQSCPTSIDNFSEGKPQNHNGGQSHNGGIKGNNGNFVSNIGDNATHNTEFGHTSNVAEGGQGTFNAPVIKGNLSGNHQLNFGSAQGSQVQGGVKAETITRFNGK